MGAAAERLDLEDLPVIDDDGGLAEALAGLETGLAEADEEPMPAAPDNVVSLNERRARRTTRTKAGRVLGAAPMDEARLAELRAMDQDHQPMDKEDYRQLLHAAHNGKYDGEFNDRFPDQISAAARAVVRLTLELDGSVPPYLWMTVRNDDPVVMAKQLAELEDRKDKKSGSKSGGGAGKHESKSAGLGVGSLVDDAVDEAADPEDSAEKPEPIKPFFSRRAKWGIGMVAAAGIAILFAPSGPQPAAAKTAAPVKVARAAPEQVDPLKGTTREQVMAQLNMVQRTMDPAAHDAAQRYATQLKAREPEFKKASMAWSTGS